MKKPPLLISSNVTGEWVVYRIVGIVGNFLKGEKKDQNENEFSTPKVIRRENVLPESRQQFDEILEYFQQ